MRHDPTPTAIKTHHAAYWLATAHRAATAAARCCKKANLDPVFAAVITEIANGLQAVRDEARSLLPPGPTHAPNNPAAPDDVEEIADDLSHIRDHLRRLHLFLRSAPLPAIEPTDQREWARELQEAANAIASLRDQIITTARP